MTAHLLPGAGKFDATFRCLIETAPRSKQNPEIRKPQGTLYVTKREEIEAGDLKRLLTTFDPRHSQSQLRPLCGRVHYTISGYDQVEEEIFEIPEVRNFYRLAHEAWPHWLYGADVSSDCLRAIAFSSIPNLFVRRSPGEVHVEVAAADLQQFFNASLPAAALLHHRAGIPKKQGVRNLQFVAAYLGIPTS